MRIEGSLSLIRLWRQEYARVYEAAHETYHAAVVQIFEQMEELHSASSALRRLNGLRRLGPPLASAALTQHQELERLLPCPATRAQLDAFLADAPFCGECGFRIGQIAPAVEAQRITTALQRGLAGQQTRLARRVIGRLLALPAEEPEARLQRFIEVVQASDLNGLAGVLDDELIGFLDDLLAGHDGHEGVLQQLARRYPEISAGEIDAVVEEFRRLLTDEAAREGIVRLRASGEGRSS
jgi:hypothetical protein